MHTTENPRITNLCHDPNHDYLTLVCSCCGQNLVVPKYCGNRFCPVCNNRRRKAVRAKLDYILSHIIVYKRTYLSHLVLTMASQDDPYQMTRQLVRAFRKLRQRKFWKKFMLGGAFVIEVTRSDSGYHVHMHVILHNYYCPQRLILKHWRKIVGRGGVFIKKIPKSAAAAYLTKYLAKPGEGVSSQIASDSMKNLRLFNVFGTFHHYVILMKKTPFPCPHCDKIAWQFIPQAVIYDVYT